MLKIKCVIKITEAQKKMQRRTEKAHTLKKIKKKSLRISKSHVGTKICPLKGKK